MKRLILVLLLLLPVSALIAGDLAVLENLGYSADGRYFMFGQHVLITDAGQAYAEIAVVDVARNDFVPGGWKKSGWDLRMLPNLVSRGALYELLSDHTDLKDRYGINHLEQGRLLYTRSNGDDTEVENTETEDSSSVLEFRDFERGREYELVLNQQNAEGEEAAASFSIDLTVTDASGAVSTYSVGNPDRRRAGVSAYRIVRVWIGPEGRSLVIAVAKEAPDLSVRYMVETVVLDG